MREEMMNLQVSDAAEKTRYQNNWRGGAWTLFVIGAFSVLNILMYMLESDSYFLFTAYFPYVCGIMGADFLMGWYGAPIDKGMGTFLLSIAAFIIILYFVLWFFARKKVGWLVAGLVLFSLDTLYMVYEMAISGDPAWFVMDCIIHAVAIAELSVGIHAAVKYGKLPSVSAPPVENPEQAEVNCLSNEENEPPTDSDAP